MIELVKNEDVREVSGKGLAGMAGNGMAGNGNGNGMAGGDGAMAVGYAAGFAEGEALVVVSRFEMQIAFYKEQALTGYIGIGRVLNEAKASGAIPHGAWEDWVVNTTGMQLRHAQRCMKAASEIRDGSFLGQLDMSKAMLLLSSGLEEEEKERLGKKASEEGATVKQLREEIKQLKLEKVRNSGAVSEARLAVEKAKAEQAQAENQLKAVYSGMQERLDAETKKAYEQGVQDQAKMNTASLSVTTNKWEQAENQRAAAEKSLEESETRRAELEKEKAELEEQIRKAQEQIRTQENLLKDVEKQSEQVIARELDEYEKRQKADRAELEKEKARLEKELRTARDDVAAEIRREYEDKIAFLNMKALEKETLLEVERDKVAEAERKQSGKWDEGYQAGLNQAAEMAKEASGARAQEVDSLAETLEAERKEWEKRLAEMREDLRAAEEREEKKAAELSRLKKEKAQASMDAARGIGAQAVGAMDLAGAVRDFIGRAGSLPQMESMIAEMNDRDREAIRVQVETVGRWVDGALAALGVVRGSGYVL